ncbi:unnamed protein product [Merluccius merluccius]
MVQVGGCDYGMCLERGSVREWAELGTGPPFHASLDPPRREMALHQFNGGWRDGDTGPLRKRSSVTCSTTCWLLWLQPPPCGSMSLFCHCSQV